MTMNMLTKYSETMTMANLAIVVVSVVGIMLLLYILICLILLLHRRRKMKMYAVFVENYYVQINKPIPTLILRIFNEEIQAYNELARRIIDVRLQGTFIRNNHRQNHRMCGYCILGWATIGYGCT